jgi:tellurite resistance protein
MFGGIFKGKAKDAINQFSGNKDFLEGLCAAAALVAAADGTIDDSEVDQAVNVIKSNSAVSAGFGAHEIELCFGKMAPKTSTRSGKMELKREISEVLERDKTGKLGQAIVLAAIDVADMGGIDAKETEVLKSLAELCGQNYDKLLNG